MALYDYDIRGYERVVETELPGDAISIIAVHNTRLGPSLGGVRFFPYDSKEAALTDVLRLSEGMSYKSAMAGLPLGGGKAVIIGDPKTIKSRALLEAFGDFVNTLDGRYITAKDVGIEVGDLDVIATRTRFVRGLSDKATSGDPSPVTAYGVYRGMQAAANFRWGDRSLRGKKVLIQGVGHVGYGVAKFLHEERAELTVTDSDAKATERCTKEFFATVVAHDRWETARADIYCPCALGATVNERTIPALKRNGVEIVAGGANNQLLDANADGLRLKDAGITYAPDFVINAGGIINIACELDGRYDQNEALEKTGRIYEVLLDVLRRASRENRPTAAVATEMAREKIGLSSAR